MLNTRKSLLFVAFVLTEWSRESCRLAAVILSQRYKKVTVVYHNVSLAIEVFWLNRAVERKTCREAGSNWSCQEIRLVYGTPNFVSIFTRVRHWFQSWTRLFQFISRYFFKFQFNIILLSGFKFPNGIFLSVGHLST